MIKLRRTINRISERLDETHLTSHAVQAAYYVIFSSIPFIMLLMMIIQHLFPEKTDYLLDTIKNLVPELTNRLPNDFWSTLLQAKVPVISITVLTVLWSASKGVTAVSNGLCSVYGTKFAKNFIHSYILAYLYTIIFMVVILATFALLVLGNFLNEMLRESSPVAYRIIETLLDFRSVIAIIFLSLFFALAYKYIAARNIPFRRQLPGAVLAGSGWIVYSLLFSLYLKYYSSYASLYGSMSVILIFMLWIHNCMLILLFGAEINMYLIRHIAVIRTKK